MLSQILLHRTPMRLKMLDEHALYQPAKMSKLSGVVVLLVILIRPMTLTSIKT